MQMTRNNPKPGSDSGILNLETWMPYRMFRIGSAVGDLMADYYGPEFGLKRTEWRTLAVVANYPNSSVKDICEIGDMDQFTVSRAITQIVSLGYAARKKSVSDGRQASLILLPLGQVVVEKVSALATEIERDLAANLTPSERRDLEGIMQKVEDATAILRARGARSFYNLEPETKA